MMYISIKLMGVVAFILTFSYVSAFFIFDEPIQNVNAYGSNFVLENESAGNYYPENVWININFLIVKEEHHGGHSNTRDTYSGQFVIDAQLQAFFYVIEFQTGCDIDEHPDGISFVSCAGAADPTGAIQTSLAQFYREYVLRTGTSPESYNENITGLSVPKSGLDAVGDILTFNFKDSYGGEVIPSDVRIVLNIFIWPLWTVLIVGILPLIGLLVQAISAGNLVVTIVKGVLMGSILLILLGWLI